MSDDQHLASIEKSIVRLEAITSEGFKGVNKRLDIVNGRLARHDSQITDLRIGQGSVRQRMDDSERMPENLRRTITTWLKIIALIIAILGSLGLITYEAKGAVDTSQVAASTDDAARKSGSTYFTTGQKSPWLGEYAGGIYNQCWRFDGIDLDSGTVVDSAFIEVYSRQDESGTTVTVTIQGEDTADATTFSTYADYNSRATTTASVAWANVASWTSATWVRSPDIAEVMQEIVDYAQREAAYAVVIFTYDQGSDTDANRFFNSYDNASATAARLITYTTEAAGPDPETTRIKVRTE
jgi:hypothetical protein